MLTEKNQKEALIVLIEWGRVHMLTPAFDQYLTELSDDFRSLLRKEIDIRSFLDNALEETKASVDSAIAVLSDTDLIMATEEDDIWYDARRAFGALDGANYLAESIQRFLASEYSHNKLQEEIIPKLDDIRADIFAWIYEGEFSPLRLTVLNQFRREWLKLIPEEKRYEFPWYEILSDLDENILMNVIEGFDKIVAGTQDATSVSLSAHLGIVLYELKRDNPLLTTIKERALFLKGLRQTASKRSALTLWRLAEDSASEYPLSEEIEKAGVVRVSVKVLEKAEVSNECEKLYWTFLAAFCGPRLSDAQRIELLKRVEKRIFSVDLAAEEIQTNIRQILRSLQRWYNGENGNSDLVGQCFNQWISSLNRVPAVMEAEEDEKVEMLWERINLIWKKSIDLSNILSKTKMWIESVISPQPQLEAAPLVWMGGDPEIERQPKIQIQKNPIEISLQPDDEGEYCFLLPPRRLLSCNAPDEYENLIYYIGNTSENHWAGWGVRSDGTTEPFGIQEVESQIFYRLNVSDYEKLIIAISSDRDLLNDFVHMMERRNEPDEPAKTNLNVVILICSLIRNDAV